MSQMPWQIQPMPLGQIFQMAMQLKGMQQSREERAEERAFRQKIEQAKANAAMKQAEIDFRKEEREQAKFQIDADKQVSDLAGPKAAQAARAARVLKSYPELYPNVRKELVASGLFAENDLPAEIPMYGADPANPYRPDPTQAPDQGQLQAFVGQLVPRIEAMATVAQPGPEKVDMGSNAAWQYASEKIGAELGKPMSIEDAMQANPQKFAGYADAYRAAELRGRKEVAKAGVLPSGSKKEVIDSLVSDELIAGELNVLKSIENPERFLTYMGKGKARALKIADMVGDDAFGVVAEALGMSPEEATWFVEDARDMMASIQNIYLPAKKEITGVSAGEKEMEDIKDSLVNKSLAPKEFMAEIRRFENTIKRNREIRARLLQTGVDLSSEAGRNLFNEEIVTAQINEKRARRGQRAKSPSKSTVSGVDAQGRQTMTVDGETAYWDGSRWVPIDG